jgi:hypothetical protein
MRFPNLLIVFAAWAALTVPASSQQSKQASSQDTAARFGLVIGNATYAAADAPLSAVTEDARQLADELRRHNFEIDLKENVGTKDMRQAIDVLMSKLRNGATGLLYFGGHGVQVRGQSYLIPVDAQITSEAAVRDQGINLDATLAEMHRRGAKVKIVIIDAARRNPYETRFRSHAAGLSVLSGPEGMLAIYSAALGKLVPLAPGAPSLFMRELLKDLRLPNRSLEDSLYNSRNAVSRATNHEQTPWVATSLFDPFYLVLETPPAAKPPTTAATTTTTPATTPQAPPAPATTVPAPAVTVAPPAAAPPSSTVTPPAAAPSAATAAAPSAAPSSSTVKPPAAGPSPSTVAPLVPDPASSSVAPPAAAPPSSTVRPLTAAPSSSSVAPLAPGPASSSVAPPSTAPATAPPASTTTAPVTTSPPVVPIAGATDPAIQELDKQIRQSPNDTAAHSRRGQLYAQYGSFPQAIRDFDTVIRLNPKDPEALNNRCWTRAIVGDLQAALNDCEAALQLRPRYADALDSRGMVYLKLGKLREAMMDYDSALRINPKHASSLYGRGVAKVRSGDVAVGNNDIAQAKKIQRDIAEEFSKYGVR